MQTHWNGARVLFEEMDDGGYEAWLENAEGGYVGAGVTAACAVSDLIDQLRAEEADSWEMAVAAADDRAHAAADRRAGL